MNATITTAPRHNPLVATAGAFLLACSFLWVGAWHAAAASLADDHTVLYYLIEMQRRYKKTCNGAPMPEAAPLTPSEHLRGLAQAHAAGGAAPGAASGLPLLVTTTQGATPQQAFNNLVASRCADLMRREYRYIGAAAQNGRWTVIMAPEDPGLAPQVQAPEPNGQAAGAASPLAPAPSPAGTQGSGSQVQAAGAPTASEPGLILVQPGDAGPVSDPAAPAAPYVVGELDTDATGRPVGSVKTVPPPGYTGPTGPASPPASTAPLAATLPVTTAPSVAAMQDGAQTAAPQFTPPPAAPRQPQPPRAGVTPLQDDRQERPVTGIGVFADGAAPEQGGQALPGAAPGMPGAPATGALSSGADRMQAGGMLPLINAVRATGRTCGSTPMPPAAALTENQTLSRAAQAHARDMTARRYLSSTTPEGITLGKRIADIGYMWGFIAENIAADTGTAEQTLQRWLADEQQCRNIMGQEYVDAGVGHDAAGRRWVFTVALPM